MTGPDTSASAPPDPEHVAVIGLHGLAGGEGVGQGTFAGQAGHHLATLAAAPVEQVSYGARLDVLHTLAEADFPGYEKHADEYRQLAESVGAPHGVPAETVLDDVKASARGDVAFADTTTAAALPHEAVAFVGADVCHTSSVWVDGKQATWIFSEFETDAPFDTLAGWVDPRSWPKRAPLLFRGMEVVGGALANIGGLDVQEHWHGEFLEEVQLLEVVRTVLHCDYYAQRGSGTGMTYELTHSVDGQINVDRGFLLATDVGGGRHRVKALKIVGFTDRDWDEVARLVCPLWTEFVRQAARGGSSSDPLPPSDMPGDGAGEGSPAFPGMEYIDDWVDFFAEATKTYTSLFTGAAARAMNRDYKARDLVKDTGRYWSQVAKDWSLAWAHGMRTIEAMSRDETPGMVPPPKRAPEPQSAGKGVASPLGAAAPSPAPPAAAESSIVPMPGLGEGALPACSDLVCIEQGATVIAGHEVGIARTTVAGGVPAVKVTVPAAGRPAGLYLGTLTVAGARPVPFQFFVSRAAPGPG